MLNKTKKILVVEDEKSLCDVIRFKLEHLGIETIVAGSAEEAIEILKKDGVDLVWLDLKLPKMNGIDFLEILKSNQEWKDKKVIVVSVSGSDEIKEKTKNLGVIDYIVKSELKLDDIIKRVIAIA
ncbi:response regulator [Candidatus Wolfebacteria bacterium]|nr:response regulator [Candidatus Wolfebacteria bacterium]